MFVYRSEHVLNGERGWVYESASGGVSVADSLQMASIQANFESDVVHSIRLLYAEGTEVAHRGIEEVEGRPAELLQVQADGRSRWMLFDAETHLLVAMDVRGGVPPQILARRVFSDHREIGGVLWPYRENRYEGRGGLGPHRRAGGLHQSGPRTRPLPGARAAELTGPPRGPRVWPRGASCVCWPFTHDGGSA